MPDVRLEIEIDGINSQEGVDALERRLNDLGVTIHTLGISRVALSYDQNQIRTPAIERAIEEAGGAVRRLQRES